MTKTILLLPNFALSKMSHESDILRANFTIQANCHMEKYFSPKAKKDIKTPSQMKKSSQLSQKPELFALANVCAINIQLLVVPCLRESKRSTNSLKRRRHFQYSDEDL